MFDLQGQSVLVVGGSSGIGLATARMGAQLGAAVTIASRSLDKINGALAQSAMARGAAPSTLRTMRR